MMLDIDFFLLYFVNVYITYRNFTQRTTRAGYCFLLAYTAWGECRQTAKYGQEGKLGNCTISMDDVLLNVFFHLLDATIGKQGTPRTWILAWS